MGRSLDGRLWGLKTKNDGLPYYKNKRKGTRGLSHRGRISKVVLGCGKKL
jgi:hypothetical protein